MIGAGGIGSAAIPALAGAGIGRLTIIDDDVVDVTNLQRQTIFRDDQVGRGKAELAAASPRRSTTSSKRMAVDRADRRRQCERNARRSRPGPRRQRQFRDPAGGQRCLRRARHSAGFGGGDPVPGAGRAVPWQALLPLLRRRCVRRRGLRQLQPNWACSARSTATVGSFAALMAIRAIVGIGEDAAGKLHPVRRRQARAGGRFRCRPIPAAGPAVSERLRDPARSSGARPLPCSLRASPRRPRR